MLYIINNIKNALFFISSSFLSMIERPYYHFNNIVIFKRLEYIPFNFYEMPNF